MMLKFVFWSVAPLNSIVGSVSASRLPFTTELALLLPTFQITDLWCC